MFSLCYEHPSIKYASVWQMKLIRSKNCKKNRKVRSRITANIKRLSRLAVKHDLTEEANAPSYKVKKVWLAALSKVEKFRRSNFLPQCKQNIAYPQCIPISSTKLNFIEMLQFSNFYRYAAITTFSIVDKTNRR